MKEKNFNKESTLLSFLQVFSTNAEFAVRSHVCVRTPEGPKLYELSKGYRCTWTAAIPQSKSGPSGDIPESLPKDEEISDDEYKGPEATSGARGGSGEASGRGGKGGINDDEQSHILFPHKSYL